jgi:tellurite resistance protein TehA-like permease
MTSANLLILLVVGVAVGAMTGVALSGIITNLLLLTFIAGLLATLIAGGVRNYIMVRGSGAGPDDSRIPTMVLVFSAIASLAGSSASIEVARLSEVWSPVWLGTLAGLFSCILLAMLMIVYYTTPGEVPKLKSRR